MKASRLSPLVLIAAVACGDTDGAPGTSSLTITNDEPAGANCTNGGVSIATGEDSNGNGKLDSAEDPTIRYVCNGANGSDGADGDGGVADQPMVTTTPAPASECPAGGVQVTVGFDRNGDGDILDANEVSGTPSYLCNGSGGGLVQAGSEPPGANCAAGGVRIQNGEDTSGNGQLEAEEVQQTTYACTDPTATNGATPIVLAATPLSDPEGQFYIASGVTQTLIEASITVPVAGRVLAITSVKMYCDNTPDATATPAASYDCATGGDSTVGNLNVIQVGVGGQTATSGSATFMYLTPGVEVFASTSEVFDIAAAGTYTFRALGLPGINGTTDTSAHANYSLPDLTLVFIPN